MSIMNKIKMNLIATEIMAIVGVVVFVIADIIIMQLAIKNAANVNKPAFILLYIILCLLELTISFYTMFKPIVVYMDECEIYEQKLYYSDVYSIDTSTFD